MLLNNGAVINALNADGETPLYYVAYSNAVDAAQIPLERNADIDAKSREGRTPLSWALERNASGVVRLFRDSGLQE